MNYRGYKDLECYKQGKELRIFVANLEKKFPTHEKFCLQPRYLIHQGLLPQTWQKVTEDLLIPTQDISSLLQEVQ